MLTEGRSCLLNNLFELQIVRAGADPLYCSALDIAQRSSLKEVLAKFFLLHLLSSSCQILSLSPSAKNPWYEFGGLFTYY